MSRRAQRITSVADARHLARRRVPRLVATWMEAGAGTGVTVERNLRAFEEISFNARAARYWPERDLETTVLGHRISMPVLAAPVGALGMVHSDGEVGVARAAGAAGTIQVVSFFTLRSIEDIAAAASGPIFMQLYYPGDREAAAPIIQRAKQAGCAALVVTVDSASEPHREYPIRGRIDLGNPGWRDALKVIPQGLAHPVWSARFVRDYRRRSKAGMVTRPDGKPITMFEMTDLTLAAAPVWEDLPWIHEQWGGPVVIKGIVSAEDARRAVDAGAAAIVVSNHGGNILDGLPATVRMLPEIVNAVGDKVEVLLDGGVRRGTDVVKALALGARAVLVGRSYIWALAAAGEPGVRQIFRVYRTDIDRALAGLGAPSVTDLDSSYVRVPADWLG
jgi:isopentenyl diphosphate isomerase/L-lactate dehydrogenase-like FMN-dependent dehydrogenase